jgi:uncharacterized membrane protein
MEIRAADKDYSSQERSLKELSPNVAALLCYVAGWVSGIVFLILEQKNRRIRFHSLQSIIVFGTLTLAGAVFGNIPFMGPGFSAIIGITCFILWIILMVKAYNGEMIKMPWGGNLAERLANESNMNATHTPADKNESGSYTAEKEAEVKASTNTGPLQPLTRQEARRETFNDKYYSYGQRSGRMISSAFAVAWSVALLIFFSFYNQYIAYYEPLHSGGTTHWQMHTLVTSDFSSWLPFVTASLVASIIGHAILITFDKILLRQLVRTVVDILGAVSIVALLTIFPFDFSVLPTASASDGVTIGLTIALIFMAVCFAISALVNFIKLIVHAVRGEY